LREAQPMPLRSISITPYSSLLVFRGSEVDQTYSFSLRRNEADKRLKLFFAYFEKEDRDGLCESLGREASEFLGYGERGGEITKEVARRVLFG
jgi:hypothetical protein